jgi:glycine/D-amino acid oxidase-like deaminating enzyme
MTESVSFWMEQLDRPARPALNQDIDVDVCVVGAGYTGLWSAYYLAVGDPTLRIAVVESEHVGFGASGRNGGWALAKLAGLERMLADPRTRQDGQRLQAAMYATLDDMAAAVAAEGIDCGFHVGGTVLAATHPAQVARLKRSVEIKRDAGFGDQHLRWLDPDEARTLIRPSRLFGASFTPHCASLDPARLALGLADAIERRGVTVYEKTPGNVDGRRVRTPGGTITAQSVVVATEAFGLQRGRNRRHAIPVYSLMVMTEPIPQPAWDEIGLDDRPTFSDGRHMIIYGQRTDDGRIAFGGRGAPYHFGSQIEPSFDHDEPTFEYIRSTLRELFPVLHDIAFVGSWGGPLAIPRDWRPSISHDRARGVVRAGGYVGQGVAAAHLAGQTVADLVRGVDSDLTTLDWVGHRSRRWEPEPLRWIGVNLGRKMTESIDHSEESGHTPRIRQAILNRLPIG